MFYSFVDQLLTLTPWPWQPMKMAQMNHRAKYLHQMSLSSECIAGTHRETDRQPTALHGHFKCMFSPRVQRRSFVVAEINVPCSIRRARGDFVDDYVSLETWRRVSCPAQSLTNGVKIQYLMCIAEVCVFFSFAALIWPERPQSKSPTATGRYIGPAGPQSARLACVL